MWLIQCCPALCATSSWPCSATRGKCSAESPVLHPDRNGVQNSSCTARWNGNTSLCTALRSQSSAQNDTWGSLSFPWHLCCSTQDVEGTVPSPGSLLGHRQLQMPFQRKRKELLLFPAHHLPLQPKLLCPLCFAHLIIPNHTENLWWEQVKNNPCSFVAGEFIVFVWGFFSWTS